MNLHGLLERHDNQIKGTLSCFDRLVFFGAYKAIGWPSAMQQRLSRRSVRLLDYQKDCANPMRLQMHERIKRLAREENLPILQTNYSQRKETLVETILEERGRRPGIVCILAAMERCRCHKVCKNHDTGCLQLQSSPGKCLHYHVYFIDEHHGLGYLRIPTWAPFRLQACINGHDWLERRMKRAGITFKKHDNCLTRVSDIEAAQQLATQLDPAALHATLNALCSRLVAVHERFGTTLHWSIYQAEWSTDILFKDPATLNDLYRQITRTAAIETNCEDIYRFMGKRPNARSKTEAATHRGVNFFRDEDASFLQALLRGEHQIGGLRNRTLQAHLPGWTPEKIGRALRRYRALGLLKTVAGTRKYYPTKLGQKLLAVGLQLKERLIIPSFAY